MADFVSRASLVAPLLSLVLGACDKGSYQAQSADGAGGVGSSASGGSTSGGATAAPPGKLPVPPGPGDAPAPSGATANLRVLPWAGFASAVSYTFDDSQPSQIDHFAELAATGVRMTFYVNPSGKSYAGYVATWQEAIAQGHEIGNHTVNHCHADLADCSGALETLDLEIDECSSYIVSELGQPSVWTFAYPFGDTGYQASASKRFFLARGVNSGTIAPNGTTNPHNLPVIPAVGGEAASVFNGHIDTASEQGRWLIFLFHSVLPTAQNWYAGVELASITESIEHAKALENVWLDSVVEIGAYWLGQRSFEASTPTTEGETITWTWELPAHFPAGRVLRVAVDGGTLSQGGESLAWDGHGYYEVALDAGALTWTP